jgi:hypothetical protein
MSDPKTSTPATPAVPPSPVKPATPDKPTGFVLPHTDSAQKPVRKPATAAIAKAHQDLLLARKGVAAETDGLTDSIREAVDIPAKVKREPLKAAALAGGAGFLLLGGPKKVLRGIGRAMPRRERDPYAGLLPDEIEKVLKDTGLAQDPRVRQALDRDFAEYLRRKGKAQPLPNARASLWRTYDTVVGPLGTVGAKKLVERLFAADSFKAGDAGTQPDRKP